MIGLLASLALLTPEGQESGHGAQETPLIDVDGTVFIQFGLFLILLLVLYHYVFQPFLQMRAEREDRIDGERRRAREMEDAARTRIAELEARLEKAKQAGITVREQARHRAAQSEREIVDRAREDSQRRLVTHREQLRKTAEAVRMRLRLSADDWARRLASRILGREVS